ncbi:MAG: hypothetical protein Q7T74_00530 [Candidatus Saccharibacteria bacterium]|nr:hypothetical protein [Candidatus Saccharibacteria bacterium]
MLSSKNIGDKRVATRKKTTTKKTAKATVKRSVAKKSTNKGFWRVEPNINTLYWIIIGIAVVAVALLSVSTNQRVNSIYDQIDSQTTETQ